MVLLRSKELSVIRSLAAAACLTLAATAAQAQPISPYASAGEQQAAMTDGRVTSEQLVRAYLGRIAQYDDAGPKLNAVLALNPHALADARKADAERREGKVRGPLHGVPILLKDNIESWDGTPTTAGSLALIANVPTRDAPVVRRLTDAGAIILGKANLSEWANFRSTRSVSGWSGVGGLVRNPYALNRNACGSSSGSGAAVAAGLAAAALGTETDGSVTCPATMNGVVGLKPTVGLVSRTYIVPLSPEQDTAGPMTRTVADAAALLTAMAGTDPLDAATAEADARKTDYLAALSSRPLKGARLGVWFPFKGRSPESDAVFEATLAKLKAEGAELIVIKGPDDKTGGLIGDLEGAALRVEFKAALNDYLASTPPAVKTRSLNDLIAFNAGEPRETQLFGQEILQQAAEAPGLDDPTYKQKRVQARTLAREALDRMLTENRLDAIVSPSGGPASVSDHLVGARWLGSPSTLPAVSGYPHLTVPMGYVFGLPIGVSFLGPAWSEGRLLSLGWHFEQATKARREPDFTPSIAIRRDVMQATDPR
jgi:amidase